MQTSCPSPLDLPSLLAQAKLTRHTDALAEVAIEELQRLRLHEGRPALLSRLKSFGIEPLPDRQQIVKALAQASRDGRVPTVIAAPTAIARTMAAPSASGGASVASEPASGGKIAFLFLIYDCIHHEDLWEAFFRTAETPEQFTLYVHAKSREGAPLAAFFESCHLPHDEIVQTEYAEISLVHAMNALLTAALRDQRNQRFVFVSGHCLPVKPFRLVYDALVRDDGASRFSHMTDLSPTDLSHVRTLLAALHSRGVCKEHVQKASQWCVLNRRLAQLCTSMPAGYVCAFKGVRAPEEWYYLTTARCTGMDGGRERESESRDGSRDGRDGDHVIATADLHRDHRGPTFANWRESHGSRPREYARVTVDELHTLVQGPSFFARKFAKGCEGLEPLRAMLLAG